MKCVVQVLLLDTNTDLRTGWRATQRLQVVIKCYTSSSTVCKLSSDTPVTAAVPVTVPTAVPPSTVVSVMVTADVPFICCCW